LHDADRVVGDLAVGEAQRAPAGGGVDRVAPGVLLERLPGPVVLPAVGLDEDALAFEDEVRLERFDVVVELGRLREAGPPAQREERLLEV
jgi:hypothetical protein